MSFPARFRRAGKTECQAEEALLEAAGGLGTFKRLQPQQRGQLLAFTGVIEGLQLSQLGFAQQARLRSRTSTEGRLTMKWCAILTTS